MTISLCRYDSFEQYIKMMNFIIVNYLDTFFFTAHLDGCFKQFSSNGNHTAYFACFHYLDKTKQYLDTNLMISDLIQISFYL